MLSRSSYSLLASGLGRTSPITVKMTSRWSEILPPPGPDVIVLGSELLLPPTSVWRMTNNFAAAPGPPALSPLPFTVESVPSSLLDLRWCPHDGVTFAEWQRPVATWHCAVASEVCQLGLVWSDWCGYTVQHPLISQPPACLVLRHSRTWATPLTGPSPVSSSAWCLSSPLSSVSSGSYLSSSHLSCSAWSCCSLRSYWLPISLIWAKLSYNWPRPRGWGCDVRWRCEVVVVVVVHLHYVLLV